MRQGIFQILKKKFHENSTKFFMRASSFSTAWLILFVRKPVGKFRFYVDYKPFNVITMKNKLPLIPKNLDRLTKTKCFTKLNIVVLFKKIKMFENEKWKTIFGIKLNVFKILIINFGFCGTPSGFQNYINDI